MRYDAMALDELLTIGKEHDEAWQRQLERMWAPVYGPGYELAGRRHAARERALEFVEPLPLQGRHELRGDTEIRDPESDHANREHQQGHTCTQRRAGRSRFARRRQHR